MSEFEFKNWIEACREGSCQGWTPRQEAIIQNIITEIELGVYSIPVLMNDMRSYVSEEQDLTTVAAALSLLGPVFVGVGPFTKRHDAAVVIEYFCARLKNEENILNFGAGIREVAEALHEIVNWECFPVSHAATIVNSIFPLAAGGGSFKDLPSPTRRAVYLLTDTVFRKKERVLRRDVGDVALVDGLINMSLFEKHPTCIDVVFALFAHLSKTWTLAPAQLDAMWESFIRYFPVSMSGTVKDPSLPSKEKMRDLLLQCIVSSDYYADGALKLCLEKLDTNSDISADTKNEVLRTMSKCVETYSPPYVAASAGTIWNSLKYEVINGDNEDFIQGSLLVLSGVTKTLEMGHEKTDGRSDDLSKFVQEIIEDCERRLSEDRQYRVQTGKILQAVASSCPYAFNAICEAILPRALTLWRDTKLESEKLPLLRVFNNLVNARHAQLDVYRPEVDLKLSQTSMKQFEVMKSKFQAQSTKLFEDVYFPQVEALALVGDTEQPKNALISTAAVDGLSILFQLPSCLSNLQKQTTVSRLGNIALVPSTDGDLRASILDALGDMSAAQPDIFRQTVLPLFISQLPQWLPFGISKNEERNRTASVLDLLVDISCTTYNLRELDQGAPSGTNSSFWHRNFDATVESLFDVLEKALTHKDQIQYAELIVAAISSSLSNFDQAIYKAHNTEVEPEQPASDGQGPYSWIIARLFKYVTTVQQDGVGAPYTAISVVPGCDVRWSDRIVECIGKISIVAQRSWLTRKLGADPVVKWHKEHPLAPSVLMTLFQTSDEFGAATQSNFDLTHAPPSKCSALILSASLLAGFEPLKVDIDRLNEVVKIQQVNELVLHIKVGNVAAAMIRNTCASSIAASKESRLAMLHFLQLLVNKFRANAEETSEGRTPLDKIMADLVTGSLNATDATAQNIIQTLAYLTASALSANSRFATKLITLMLGIVTGSSLRLGSSAAKGFRIILAPSDILNKENFCQIWNMRESKLFNMVFTPLRTAWSTGNATIKANCLAALAGVIGHMDALNYAYTDFAPFLLPLVLEGMELQGDDWAKITYVKIAKQLILLRTDLVMEHLRTVIHRLTNRTHNDLFSPSDSSVECRVLALEALQSIIQTFSPTAVLKERRHIDYELKVASDDASPDVRDAARKCSLALLYVKDEA